MNSILELTPTQQRQTVPILGAVLFGAITVLCAAMNVQNDTLRADKQPSAQA
jgi:hypothetical protein